jgi:NADH:ubiquinone oxidoreductase subunit 3 (subunit A)
MENQSTLPPGTPSHQQQQWGVIISIVIIVLMIVVGAFYAWGKRISQQNALTTESTTTAQ